MSAEVFVGLDVSKTILKIAVRPSGEHWTAGVDDAGMNETAEKIRDIHPNLVVMEAHGGVELPVAGTLASLGLPFALVSPRSIKDFTRAIGGMRQDRSQAGLLAHFAELVRPEVRKEVLELLTLMLAPMTPHLAEELWEMLGHTQGLSKQNWPQFAEELARDDEVELVVQVNGRVRGRLKVAAGLGETAVVPKVLADPAVAQHVNGKKVVKWIFVKDKLVNLVVAG